jgi:hypothetical protein
VKGGSETDEAEYLLHVPQTTKGRIVILAQNISPKQPNVMTSDGARGCSAPLPTSIKRMR